MFRTGEKFVDILAGFIIDFIVALLGFAGFEGIDGIIELRYERADLRFGHCC